MFANVDDRFDDEYPRNSSFTENDWHILASFWHPVAFSNEVQDKPIRVKLLDLYLVLYRTKTGLTAANDVCAHRGAALSLGWIDEEGENVVCPMHGLHYNHEGTCTAVPSISDSSRKISSKLCLRTYQVTERYGLIWVCLKPESVRPMPEWPLLEEATDDWLTIKMPKGFWNASASRHTENFNDIAHLSWVHVQTFGNRNRPEIPSCDLKRTDYGLTFHFPYTEVERMFFDSDDETKERRVTYTHYMTYPFATDLMLEHELPDGTVESSHIYDIASPVSARETAIFQMIQTNIEGATAEDYIAYQGKVNEEDAPLVESQRPEDVPLNVAAEIHIPADKFSIQYRRDMMNLFGLGNSPMTA